MHLKSDLQRLEKAIREAFAEVTREGGVSWSETFVRDDYGSEEQCLEARKRDRDRFWTEVLDDATWDPDRGIGGWAFLDPIGFCYYLPAGMIRSLRLGYDSGINDYLLEPRAELREHAHKRWSLLNEAQGKCVAEYLTLFAQLAFEADNDYAFDDCEAAVSLYWGRYLPAVDPEPRTDPN